MTLLPLIQADVTEKRCIQQGPHSTIQGEVINHLPGGRVAIRCNGEIYTGRPVPVVRKGEVK